MPLPTMIIVVVTGVIALAYFPGLEGASADQIFGNLLREVQMSSIFGYGLVLVILSAVLAAMMSTADSALLSLSSMLTKDVFARCFFNLASEEQLTLVGKIFSWTMLLLLVLLAIALREEASLVQLLDRKLDLLIQIAPVFILGLRWRSLNGSAAAIGLLAGISIALILAYGDLTFVNNGKVFNFHPGVVAVIPNLTITILLSLWFNRRLVAKNNRQNSSSINT
jgi:Na+/proline symporter